MKNGQNLGAISHAGSDTGDNINESISAINFSFKGSRYLCSGGTGKVVRIWDMQRRRCIKWLKGHADTITGVTYNNKDEHLASISVKGDLILHNLASGTRAADLKDPHSQVLRVLEASRMSRHLLITAGDDGSVHLWDTTGRTPKVSWVKQHSAPTTGVAFSPCNDKMIISVGLDKKLYTFDPLMKKPVHCIPSEAPFSSLSFKDDGLILAAGTNSGRVVFYDVRGKPQPFTILRAYGTSEAVTSLCWQRSNPILINESSCTPDVALLGTIGEDSVLMPDPLPAPSSGIHGRTSTSSFLAKTSGRSSLTAVDNSSLSGLSSTSVPLTSGSGVCEENFSTSVIPPLGKGAYSRLQTPRNSYIIKDDMEVFSPLVDVQPITPSISGFWDSNDDLKKDSGGDRKVAWGPSANVRRFPSMEEFKDDSLISPPDFRTSLKEELQSDPSSSSPMLSTPLSSLSPKAERSPSVTPPEAWGGDAVGDRVTIRGHNISRFASRSSVSGSLTSRASMPSMTDSFLASGSDIFNPGASNMNQALDTSVSEPLLGAPTRKLSTYADRNLISRSLPTSTAEVPTLSGGSPRQKKSVTEKSDDNNALDGKIEGRKAGENESLRPDAAVLTGATSSLSNGHVHVAALGSQQEAAQQGPPSFALQLVQRTLEESLGAVQKAIHDDVQNLHLELLRQFHVLQMEMVGMMDGFLSKQMEMMDEIQALRRENQQLRNLF
ncbi:hypothetical protein KP509_09G082900 [Ceratopteris richardii]|nr:hypothetical protein KP509_09G082900 [Ceratopteris richardii]